MERAFKKTIMRKFIGHVARICLVIFLAELFLSLITHETEWDFSEALSMSEEFSAVRVIVTVVWLLVVAGICFAGVRLFGKTLGAEVEKYSALRLKEAEDERMKLFSNIAHDLKTPMTTISGYACALADGLVDENKQKEYLLAMKVKSNRLNQLIDQLLSYSKLGASGFLPKFAETDLAELVREVCASVFDEIESRRMDLTLDLPNVPVICMLDPMEMNRVFYNLMANAVKHNPPGSSISVRLDQNSAGVTIEIADNGAEIPEEIRKDIFEPFVSGSESRDSNNGTGLGLAIVKKIAEAHAGTARLIKAPPPYTKAFAVTLPKE